MLYHSFGSYFSSSSVVFYDVVSECLALDLLSVALKGTYPLFVELSFDLTLVCID